MRWISMVLGAVLLVVVAAQPAGAVVVVITTGWGNFDAPSFAVPAMFMTVFLTHANGKRYRCNTGPRGFCILDIASGMIVHWQAYDEDRFIANGGNIPIGNDAINRASAGAKTQTAAEAETSQNADTPGVVVVPGSSPPGAHSERGVIFSLTAGRLIKIEGPRAAEIARLSDEYGVVQSYDLWVNVFFPANRGVIGGGGNGSDGGDGGVCYHNRR